LQHVGATIKQAIRMTDIAGRVGGDEFAVFFPETNEEQVRKATEKLINALEKITNMSGCQVTASIEVLTRKENGDSYDALLGKADKLMYVAKEKGKNVAEFMMI
jgi:diguanylate cyclase (GGDEF)-like protein